MSIDEKLRTIDYVCHDCEVKHNCAYLSGEKIIFRCKAEERFSSCKLLRDRISNIERAFNAIYVEDLNNNQKRYFR